MTLMLYLLSPSISFYITMDWTLCLLLSIFWISRSLHSKLKLGSSSSSSLTDLSQAKTPGGGGGGGDKAGITGGLAEECSKDKGTQQRRAGANATWNRLVCEIFLISVSLLNLEWMWKCFCFCFFGQASNHPQACMFTHLCPFSLAVSLFMLWFRTFFAHTHMHAHNHRLHVSLFPQGLSRSLSMCIHPSLLFILLCLIDPFLLSLSFIWLFLWSFSLILH